MNFCIIKGWEMWCKVSNNVLQIWERWLKEKPVKMCLCILPGFWHREGEWEDAKCSGHQFLFSSWPTDGVAVVVVLWDGLASPHGSLPGSGLYIYTEVLNCLCNKMQLIIKQSSAEGGNNFHFGFIQAWRKKKHEHRKVWLFMRHKWILLYFF